MKRYTSGFVVYECARCATRHPHEFGHPPPFKCSTCGESVLTVVEVFITDDRSHPNLD